MYSLLPRPNFLCAPCGLVEKQGMDTFTRKIEVSSLTAISNYRCSGSIHMLYYRIP